MSRLESQISASMPAAPKLGAPDLETSWAWAEDLCESALEAVNWEMSTEGAISFDTAWRVQLALTAALVTGLYCPPPRLHVILTLIHPKYNGKVCCPDSDCLQPGCLGNRLLVEVGEPPFPEDEGDTWTHFDYKSTSVKFVVVHSKNDRCA